MPHTGCHVGGHLQLHRDGVGVGVVVVVGTVDVGVVEVSVDGVVVPGGAAVVAKK